MPHKNRYKLRIEYEILQNHYLINKLNLIFAKLLKLIIQRLTELKSRILTIFFTAATVLKFLFIKLFVKCECKNKCDTKRCNCIKNNVKCIQYCHSEHSKCNNLFESIAKQTEILLTFKSKRKKQLLSFKKTKKQSIINQTKPFFRTRGIQPSIDVFFLFDPKLL